MQIIKMQKDFTGMPMPKLTELSGRFQTAYLYYEAKYNEEAALIHKREMARINRPSKKGAK